MSKGKSIVMVDDICTSGGSDAALVFALNREGVKVDFVVGYYGRARLQLATQKTIDGL